MLCEYVFSIKSHIECCLLQERQDDALTTDNEVDYQNCLTTKNAPFALTADSLFTNYKWTKKGLGEAESTGERYGLHPTETYFGIDVWAQNTDMPGPRRITFPPKDGGGTNTGLVSFKVHSLSLTAHTVFYARDVY